MSNRHLARSRRRLVGLLLIGVGLVWLVWPGQSALWGRRAKPEADGRALFEHEWTANDPLAGGGGRGPVYNARSCVACHFQGGVGGAGTSPCNVLTFEVLPSQRDPRVRTGVVHNFAVSPSLKESPEVLFQLFPLGSREPKVLNGAAADPVRMESINAPALFGAGRIDRISDGSIKDNCRRQGPRVSSSGERPTGVATTLAGRVRILPDGRVGKFGWKAQFATLGEFVAAACANEIGLGTPLAAKARSLVKVASPPADPDLDQQQFAALYDFVDRLPRPVQVLPDGERERAQAVRGAALFRSIGCASCHTPDLGGVRGVYSDFLLHRLTNESAGGGGYCNHAEPDLRLAGDHPLQNEWKTPPLWGVADSAPYFHDGGSDTLQNAIFRHEGEAMEVKLAYRRLSRPEQEEVIAFLLTLKAPADAIPATGPGTELRTPWFPQQPPDCFGGWDW